MRCKEANCLREVSIMKCKLNFLNLRSFTIARKVQLEPAGFVFVLCLRFVLGILLVLLLLVRKP